MKEDINQAELKWAEANAAYLSAALSWLRARLEAFAAPKPPAARPPETALAAEMKPARFTWKRTPAKAVAAPLVPGSMAGAQDPALARSVADLAPPTENGATPPALVLLAQRLGLYPFEQDILLLCAAMELDTRIPTLCAQAQGDSARPYPTFALALALFADPAWGALSPERPLRSLRLLEVNQAGTQPLTASALRLDERILSYLKGLNYLDERLAPMLVPMPPLTLAADVPLPPSHRQAADQLLHRMRRHHGGRLPVVQLLGPDTPSKELVVQVLARELPLQVHRLTVQQLPQQAHELDALLRLWQRESMLLPLALYLVADEAAAQSPVFANFLSRVGGMVFLDTREAWPGLAAPVLAVDIARADSGEQQAAWGAALKGTGAEASAAQLAAQFDVDFARLQHLARSAREAGDADAEILHRRLWDACLASARPRMDALAVRLVPKATWDDLVLPPAEMEMLRQISSQVRQRGTVYQEWGFANRMNRGLGINALFAGDSGTGKTMAAEVLANDLRLDLYRIDLSAVVSKYIGETEKNLRRMFDAAEDGAAILFFDEADALFGKRSEVRDSHDRYANIEINYLLQRMESYRGLAILATNMKSALDAAFLRRLRFVVNFPFPTATERKAIWRKAFPAAAPAEGLDFDRLARLNLTGGHIHNIAINAAFLAARANMPITMPLAMDAARSEFRKLERPINEADFRCQETAAKTGARP
ncbi:ATP-binding protein [Pseudoduganella sp. HUAS MS19]